MLLDDFLTAEQAYTDFIIAQNEIDVLKAKINDLEAKIADRREAWEAFARSNAKLKAAIEVRVQALVGAGLLTAPRSPATDEAPADEAARTEMPSAQAVLAPKAVPAPKAMAAPRTPTAPRTPPAQRTAPAPRAKPARPLERSGREQLRGPLSTERRQRFYQNGFGEGFEAGKAGVERANPYVKGDRARGWLEGKRLGDAKRLTPENAASGDDLVDVTALENPPGVPLKSSAPAEAVSSPVEAIGSPALAALDTPAAEPAAPPAPTSGSEEKPMAFVLQDDEPERRPAPVKKTAGKRSPSKT